MFVNSANLAKTKAQLAAEEWATRTRFSDLVTVPVFWHTDFRNFGDRLTTWLLPRYGILPRFARASRASLIGVGSILSYVPSDYAGGVWGSGLIRDESWPLPHANFFALRGPLTAERVGASGNLILGDPGLLVSEHVAALATPPRWRIGLVPHKIHRSNQTIREISRRYPELVTVIDVTKSPTTVASSISTCSSIISSSLHGIVVADSLGIPAAWTSFDPALAGIDFKFRDHEAALSSESREVEINPLASIHELAGLARPVSRKRVADAVKGLESSLIPIRASLQNR